MDPFKILQTLMNPQKDIDAEIESIKKSALRTKILFDHIDKMLDIYKAHCFASKRETDRLRWSTVNKFYIEFPTWDVKKIADELNVSESRVYNYIDEACDALVVYIFGIDGLSYTDRPTRKRKQKKPETD